MSSMISKLEVHQPAWYRTLKQLSWLDILLPFTIILSIIVGLIISEYAPNARKIFEGNEQRNFVGVSIPLTIGMIIMMLPPLCRVEWESLPRYVTKREIWKQLLWSLVLNWIVCPFLMFGLAWLVLFKEPEYREGIIMIGMARCIAMVITWNMIAGGDLMLCVTIVIINSTLQMILYAPYVIFFGYVITGQSYDLGANLYNEVAKSVSVFLGIPLGAGFFIRFISFALFGKDIYVKKIIPWINPWGMVAFHYTIIIIFIGNGKEFLNHIGSAFLCFIPLCLYFFISWFGCFFLIRYVTGRRNKFNSSSICKSNMANRGETHSDTESIEDSSEGELYSCSCEKELLLNSKRFGKSTCSAKYNITMTQCFTAASNNFELSMAVAVSIFGNGSKQAVAATFGPLLEVPILLLLAIIAKYFENAFIWASSDLVEDQEQLEDMEEE